MKLCLTTDLRAEIVAHVRSGLPDEACGLLWGLDGRVLLHFPAENIANSPIRYEMDPIWQVAVMHEMYARGLELVGIYHSHPAGPSGPSASDAAQAYYPDCAYLILFPGPDGEWLMRAFRIMDERVREVEVLIEEDES